MRKDGGLGELDLSAITPAKRGNLRRNQGHDHQVK